MPTTIKYMEQEVLQRRNEVFDVLHRRTTVLYALYVRKPLQWTIELLLLVTASVILALWVYVHFTYMTNPANCLHEIAEEPIPRDIILQVEVYSNSTTVWKERQYALTDLYESTIHSSGSDTAGGVENNSLEEGDDDQEWISVCANAATYIPGTQFLCEMLFNNLSVQMDEFENGPLQGSDPLSHEISDSSPVTNPNEPRVVKMSDEAFFAENRTLHELMDPYSLKLLCFDYSILEFAQEPGYLSLTQSSRAKLNVTVKKLFVDPEQARCFGGPFGKFLSKYFLGYDMMIITSFKTLLPTGHASGFVKNLLTGDQYYYKVQWMGKWRYGAGLLPVLFFTLVASVLLRQINYHIFKFLTHFQHLVNQGLPMPVQTGAQIPLMIVTYAGIGLVIVMSEALGDDSVFSLLMVATVWETDQFYSMFCKHQTSRKYFPWFFFLYHFLSYAYYIRFSGQFWFIPFTLHFILLQHAMLYFFHRFELPRNVQLNPRQPQQVYVAAVQPQYDIAQGADQHDDSDDPMELTDHTQPLSTEESTVHVVLNSNFVQSPQDSVLDVSSPDSHHLARQRRPERCRESDHATGD